jgi:putative peptide zinc metalloprotease protein
MNLTRALEVALPDIPGRVMAERYPRLDPGTTAREHIEDGKPIIRVYVPNSNCMYKLPPANWKLVQLFDGNRSYEEIAQLYSQENGVEFDANEVREFAASLEEIEFWYKTAQEKNIRQVQQIKEKRRKKIKQKSRWADLSLVTFPAFNPDGVLTALKHRTEFIFTTWFTVLTLIGFAITTGITVTHWAEIGRDTKEFYNFSNKTAGDIAILYALVFAVVFIHEFAHAFASKHFGSRVTAMGFALCYLTPALYTDTTEAEVMTSRSQRLIVTVAGVWSELMVCAIATIVWWGTAPDTALHNGAYFLMMITGFVSILVNWNPLIKLDGYHLLSDIIDIADLKEKSTAYVSGWVKKNVWQLPVEVPYVPRRRRAGYAVYALLSGVYSYSVMYLVARFAGNVVRNFSPEWGFIPEIAVALLIFRSRIRMLVNFMKFVYLDKKDRIHAWFTAGRSLAVAVVALLLLLLPIWRESTAGKFILEPLESVEIHARVPGVVSSLWVQEGKFVEAGASLATLSNLPLQANYEEAKERLAVATDEANEAALRYSNYGSALKEREHVTTEVEQLSGRNAALQLTSPISGVVLTPRVMDLLGSYIAAGTKILEIGDLSALRARIYISEYDLATVEGNALAKLQVQGFAREWRARIVSVAPRPTEMDPNLVGEADLKGMNPPHFYIVDLLVSNSDGKLRPGMAGYARVYGRRRSLSGMLLRGMLDFGGRKLW